MCRAISNVGLSGIVGMGPAGRNLLFKWFRKVTCKRYLCECSGITFLAKHRVLNKTKRGLQTALGPPWGGTGPVTNSPFVGFPSSVPYGTPSALVKKIPNSYKGTLICCIFSTLSRGAPRTRVPLFPSTRYVNQLAESSRPL